MQQEIKVTSFFIYIKGNCLLVDECFYKKKLKNKIKTNPLDDDGDEEHEALLAQRLVAPRLEKKTSNSYSSARMVSFKASPRGGVLNSSKVDGFPPSKAPPKVAWTTFDSSSKGGSVPSSNPPLPRVGVYPRLSSNGSYLLAM